MKRSIIAVAGLVALVGCSDVEGPDVERARSFSQEEGIRREQVSRGRSDGTTGNIAARKWFDISIDVGTNLRPRTPIELTVTYEGTFATTDADLLVKFPEIESAKLTGWGQEYKTQVGVELPARVERNQAFAAGDKVVQSTTFTVDAPGIYRVLATARANKVRPDETTGRAQPVVHEDVWILVDDTGGGVMEIFDPDAVPEGFVRQPGPFRELPRSGQPKPHGAASAIAMRGGLFGMTSCGSNEVCFSVQYDDNDVGYKPVPSVAFEYTEIDGQTGYEQEVGSIGV